MPVEVREVVHVNVNCSDLQRSLRFYRDFVGLRALSHARPSTPQDGSGFGFEGKALWDAYLMHDARGAQATGIDLLQWEIPRPVGRPHPALNHLGLARLCIRVPDLDELHARLAAAGSPIAAPPQPARISQDLEARSFCCPDPDGSWIQFFENRGGAQLQLSHVILNVSHLDAAGAWYERVLGLERSARAKAGPLSGTLLGIAGEVEWESLRLAPKRSSGGFGVELVEWKQPRSVGQPYARANQLGIYRIAFLVDSCEQSHAELRRLGISCAPPSWLELGPEIPIAGLSALFFRDPDGTCVELIERPRIRE
jgi:catechol 2,3-dioxygenase-like lactoylglutathione lyase family enzyme